MTAGALAETTHDGPCDPATAAVPRRPGSVRRVTVVDIVRPDGLDGDVLLHGVGRDSRADSPDLLDEASLDLTVDYRAGRTITALSSAPALPALQNLVGTSAASGLRRAAGAAVPDELARRSVLYQLLDDVPVTTLISGYALAALRGPTPEGHARLAQTVDLCAGYQAGGTMMQWIDRQNWVPTVYGPASPPVVADPDEGWPALRELPPTGMRRHRLLDVSPAADGTLRVYAWFRDLFHRPDGDRTIVHEYEIDANVETVGWTVLDITATPRVLPWVECPQAAASAGRLTGTSLLDVREDVRKGFVGPPTCTHLNDQLRSLADVVALGRACVRSS